MECNGSEAQNEWIELKSIHECYNGKNIKERQQFTQFNLNFIEVNALAAVIITVLSYIGWPVLNNEEWTEWMMKLMKLNGLPENERDESYEWR